MNQTYCSDFFFNFVKYLVIYINDVNNNCVAQNMVLSQQFILKGDSQETEILQKHHVVGKLGLNLHETFLLQMKKCNCFSCSKK